MIADAFEGKGILFRQKMENFALCIWAECDIVRLVMNGPRKEVRSAGEKDGGDPRVRRD